MHDLFKLEQFSRDSFRVKRTYIDICGDLIAGILLGQIVFWNMPNEHGNSKLRVYKEGELWLAKGRTDWWDEIRITPKQFDRAIKILEEKNFVIVKKFRFNGSPTIHIKLNMDGVLQAINSKLTYREIGISPKGKIEIDQKGNSLTEITTENTTESIVSEPNIYQFYEQSFGGTISPIISQQIEAWVNDTSEELVMEAMKIAKNKKKGWQYAGGILKQWAQQGIKHLSDLEKTKKNTSAPRQAKTDVWDAFQEYMGTLGGEEDDEKGNG